MIELRELTAEEFPLVKELFRRVFTAPPWNDDWSDDSQLENYLLDLMQVRTPIDLGLYEDGRLIGISIGCVKHWCGGTEYMIEELCLAPECQGKGLGRRFMELIEAHISERGIRQIFLMTQKAVPAFGFYRRMGFTQLEALTSFFKEL